MDALQRYQQLAKDLLKAYKSGDPASLKRIQEHHQRPLTLDELRQAAQWQLRKLNGPKRKPARLTLADAQRLIAVSCSFGSWPVLKKRLEAPASIFETAADAVIAGDLVTIRRLLRENPNLIRARSPRKHNSTLLHYVSANGVEGFRQKTPKNIVAVTKLLLKAGPEVDAENNPGRGTALGLVATSVHPAQAGVQIALLDTLLKAGASPDGLRGGWNPLTAALANGRGTAAEFLARRGARLDLEGAAGVGRLDAVKSLFKSATKDHLEKGFMWACEYGRTRIVKFLLKQGFDVATTRGCTGLHWAAYSGHAVTVQALLEGHAPVNIKDGNFNGTPLGWALYAWADPPPEANRAEYYKVVALLIASGATVDQEWLSAPNRERPILQKIRADRRMQAALRGKIR